MSTDPSSLLEQKSTPLEPKDLVGAALQELGETGLDISDILDFLAKRGTPLDEKGVERGLHDLGYEVEIVPQTDTHQPQSGIEEKIDSIPPKEPTTTKVLLDELKMIAKEKYKGKLPPAVQQALDEYRNNKRILTAQLKTARGKAAKIKIRADREALDTAFRGLIEDFKIHEVNPERPTNKETRTGSRGKGHHKAPISEKHPRKWSREDMLRTSPVLSVDDVAYLRSKGWTDKDFEAHRAAQTDPTLLMAEKKRLEKEIAYLEAKGEAIFDGEKWLLENNLRPNLASIQKILDQRSVVLNSKAAAASSIPPTLQDPLATPLEYSAPTTIAETEVPPPSESGAETPSSEVIFSGPSEQRRARIASFQAALSNPSLDIDTLIGISIGLAKETGDAERIARNNVLVTEARMEAGHNRDSLEPQKKVRAEITATLEVLAAQEQTASTTPEHIPEEPLTSPLESKEGEVEAVREALRHIESDLHEKKKTYFDTWKRYGKNWLLDPFEAAGKQYNAASLKLKLALSATIIVAALSGSGAVVGAVGIIGLSQKGLGIAGTFVGAEALLNAYREKRSREGKEDVSITKHPKVSAAILATLLGLGAGPAFSNVLALGEERLGSFITSASVRDKLALFFNGQFVDAFSDDSKFGFQKPTTIPSTEIVKEVTPPSQPETPLPTTSPIEVPTKQFTDAIDKPGDSVWRSMKEILRTHSEDFGWKENNITSKELWLDRRVAEIMQNNPDIAGQNLVHEGGVVHLEIIDGDINAWYEAPEAFADAPKDIPASHKEVSLPGVDMSSTPPPNLESGADVPTTIHPTDTETPSYFIRPGSEIDVATQSIETGAHTETPVSDNTLSKANMSAVITQRNSLIDAAFGKPGFFGFGKVDGLTSPDWLQLQKIPASEILAAPSYDQLNIRYRELFPTMSTETYEKAHTLIVEESKFRGTIPISTETPQDYLTRSISKQYT